MGDAWWSWALTLVGATCFILAGGLGKLKIWWAWYVGLAGQILWLAYSLITEQWGFLAGVVIYTGVYVRNAVKWTREHLQAKHARERDAERERIRDLMPKGKR